MSDPIDLDAKYAARGGRVFVSGLQALVRLAIEQRLRDRAAGLATAGYVSGYRGSPLGGFDQELARAERFLAPLDVLAKPAVNEDLAATAIWGTQQVDALGDSTKDGVFGLWYGKGPGVDRCGDVFRHGNTAGTSPHGGVLLLAGDDHAAKSSTIAHQSEFAFVDAMIPVLHPSTLAQFIGLGLHGLAMSRYTGLWVAMKLTGSLVESSATIDLDGIDASFVRPDGAIPDVRIRWPDTPVAAEARLHNAKWPALAAWVRANPIDRAFHRTPASRVGIVATGKAWLDVEQALVECGIDGDEAVRRGLALYRCAMPWPLDADAMRTFASGLDTVLVVEDKRALIEPQVRDALYATARRPVVVGKVDRDGAPLLPATLELDATQVLAAFSRVFGWHPVAPRPSSITIGPAPLLRTPSFCSGCPHNSSTVVPDDALALGGIGCHAMAVFVPGSRTATFTQMGGEGASWIGMAPFSKRGHVFQNLGDGTYFHSGSLGIRAAIAAGVDITFKVLYNDAVAMTGGQPVDGSLFLAALIAQVRAEGVTRVAVSTDDVDATRAVLEGVDVDIVDRAMIDALQRDLASTRGTTVLVHAQMCAAEKRRRRRRGKLPAPTVAVHIAADVCEGCGDCGKVSGCLSIQPRATLDGQKRRIDTTSCNVDLSCLRGFCPSFVTIENVRPRGRDAVARPGAPPMPTASLPTPATTLDQDVHRVLVAGVGGTGVTTLGSVLAMAAHLDGLACSVHDMTGLAQKGGPVFSHLAVARDTGSLTTPVIPSRQARALLGCDLVVAASSDALAKLAPDAQAVVSTHVAATSDFARNPASIFPSAALVARLERTTVDGRLALLDARRIASSLAGSGEALTFVVAGAAWQAGCLPISATSIDRAIELNGVGVDANRRAFAWGRAWIADPRSVVAAIESLDGDGPRDVSGTETLDALVARLRAHLRAYQGDALVARFDAKVDAIADAARRCSANDAEAIVRTFATAWARALAPKDEYEVARLLTDPALRAEIRASHETGGEAPRLAYHLAPPLFARIGPDGRPTKRRYGAWLGPVLRVVAGARALRGTWLDPFARTSDRRLDEALRARVSRDADRIVERLDAACASACIALAAISLDVKGYGPIKAANFAALASRWDALSMQLDDATPIGSSVEPTRVAA